MRGTVIARASPRRPANRVRLRPGSLSSVSTRSDAIARHSLRHVRSLTNIVSDRLGGMTSLARIGLLVGAVLAAAGSAKTVQQATSSPALTGGTCEGACKHYFDCK